MLHNARKVQYKGYVFKSRVEFAWAQWFEHEGLTWAYEPETFRVGRNSYTPDFRIGADLYIEIKAAGARNLHNHYGLCHEALLIIFGEPDARPYIRLKPAGAHTFTPGRNRGLYDNAPRYCLGIPPRRACGATQ